jgi:uncharacterized membrane protein (UPF0127 family)
VRALAAFLLVAALAAGSDGEEAVVTMPDGTAFICEIADTGQEHAIGLSRRQSLAPDRGMLFIYPRDSLLSFWMPPQMQFSLDLIFLDSEARIIHIAHDAPPCTDTRGWDCPSYGPGSTLGRYVVELNAGMAAKHGLQDGDTLTIKLPCGYVLPTSRNP